MLDNIVITIHQAIFGDKEDGYGLLRATCDTDLARQIANSTDIHEQTPDGIYWTNSLRGFALDTNYLLMRTFTDMSPKVRQGRVFSHCLIIPLSQIKKISDLRNLLTYLPSDIKKESALEQIEYYERSINPKIASSRISFLIKKLINDDTDLFAWIDYPEYEDAVCTIWSNISAEIRQSLRFGIAFSPNESKGRPGIKILSVPAQLLSKWRGDGISVVMPDDTLTAASDLEKLLSGNHKSNDLYKFIYNYGIIINQISDYLHLQKVLKTVNNLDNSDINSLLTLLNTLAVFNFKNNFEKTLKNELAEQIKERLKLGTMKEIIRVRNENFELFISTAVSIEIGDIIKEKATELIFSSPRDVTDLVTNIIKPNIQIWWQNNVKQALVSFFHRWKESYSLVVLEILDTDNYFISILMDELIPVSANENSFISEIKRNSSLKNFSSILGFSLKRKWFKLHAVCLTKIESVKNALNSQHIADPYHYNITAFEIITENYPFVEVFEAAKTLRISFITSLVADLCIKNKNDLKSLDWTDVYCQEILLAMVIKKWDFGESLINPKASLYLLLDAAVSNDPFNQKLLVEISKNSSANLYNYQNRIEVWEKLPGESKINFLNHTAWFILENGKLSDYASLEIELKHGIRQDIIDEFVNKYSNSINKVLPVFDILITKEAYVKDYIRYYSTQITITESILLGRLINKNNWNNCAKEVYDKAKYFSSFKDALAECYNQLGFYDRLSLSLTNSVKNSISESEWWIAFEETSIELFPEGPKQKKIWEESGGKLQDLELSGNGRQQWRYALSMVKNGASIIKIKNLLKTMLAEYKNNPHLTLLKQWLKNE